MVVGLWRMADQNGVHLQRKTNTSQFRCPCTTQKDRVENSARGFDGFFLNYYLMLKVCRKAAVSCGEARLHVAHLSGPNTLGDFSVTRWVFTCFQWDREMFHVNQSFMSNDWPCDADTGLFHSTNSKHCRVTAGNKSCSVKPNQPRMFTRNKA